MKHLVEVLDVDTLKLARLKLNKICIIKIFNKEYKMTNAITDTYIDELSDEFMMNASIVDGYEEYEILLNSVFNKIPYDVNQTICRYKKYIDLIKLEDDLEILLNQFIEKPDYLLMKKIDTLIYNMLQ